ncbi:MAG TPA: hypothetical protein PLZ51_18150, partial [Aggregatilineales bacterium]|nr:hypothetical protein [Aggregatilineales bacterium]
NTLETQLIGTGGALNLTTGTLNGQITTITVTQSSGYGVFLNGVSGTLVSSATGTSDTVSEGIRIENSSVDANFSDTIVAKGSAGNAILLNNNTATSDIVFGAGGNLFAIFTINGSGLVATNHDGSITINGTSASSDVTVGSGSCFNIDGPAGLTTIAIQVDTCTTTTAPTYGIRLQDTDGALFRIANATAIDSSLGAQEGILLENADTTTIDISGGSTVNITNRRDEAVRVSNSNGTSLLFGAVTANNP